MKRFFSIGFDWLGEHWRGLASAFIVATIAVTTLSLQITTLLPGQNKYETATVATLKSFPIPWDNPINAPYFVPTYVVSKAINNPLEAGRLVSVIYGLLAAGFMFYVLKKWFNIRMATVGSLLFVTSSWLLHVSHVATPLILMVVAPLACLAAFNWLIRTKKFKILAVFSFVTSLALAAYVPYMFWVLLITITVLWLQSRDKVKELEQWQWIAGGTLYAILVTPLVAGLINNFSLVKPLLGIPAAWPTMSEYAHRFFNLVITPFFRSPLLPELHLGRLPLLDIFSTAMFILGIYYFSKRMSNRRTIILFSSFAVLLLIIPLSPAYFLNATILLPLIYICVISGVVELLKQWFSYFPRNPLARSIGVALVVIAIGFTSFYQLERYFIAWPNTPDTKSVYVVQSK